MPDFINLGKKLDILFIPMLLLPSRKRNHRTVTMNSNLTTDHLAWILNISREWERALLEIREPMKAAMVQERMNAKFPTSEHVMLWERLLEAIGAR